MDLLCSVGLSCCQHFINYTKEVGKFLSWQELLGIGGIIFAAIQFMEGTKIRNYIYRFGWLYKATPLLMAFSTISVIVATFVQLTDTNIPLISYPAFYEILALASLSVLFLFYMLFLLRPKFFLSYSSGLLNKIRGELLNNQSDESFSALSRIVGKYLENIVKSASLAKKPMFRKDNNEPSKEEMDALSFIDIDMSTPNFVRYIALNNLNFIIKFIRLSEKCELWDAGGGIFVDRLSEALFTNENSLLSRELMFGGISGLQKPITNLLFCSKGMLSHYGIFGSFRHWSSEISIVTLKNWTSGLEVALRHYFSEVRNVYYTDTPNDALSYSIERLGECIQSIVPKINKYKGDDIWDNEYGSKLSIIGRFFSHLNSILIQDDPKAEYQPKLSEQERKVEERTVAEGISKALFAYLEGFTWMDNEEYARMHAIEPYWVVFDGQAIPVLQGIRSRVLGLIKERVAKNLKNRYASMIRLMLLIYDGAVRGDGERGNEIQQYVSDEFRKQLAPRFLKDKKFREEHMPKHWFVSTKKTKIYRKIYGRTELLYPVKLKRSKR